jgi:hypothetical protein
MTEVWTVVGDFFEWTFTILPILNNGPNVFFSLIIVVYFFYWMVQMRKHKRAGEN